MNQQISIWKKNEMSLQPQKGNKNLNHRKVVQAEKTKVSLFIEQRLNQLQSSKSLLQNIIKNKSSQKATNDQFLVFFNQNCALLQLFIQNNIRLCQSLRLDHTFLLSFSHSLSALRQSQTDSLSNSLAPLLGLLVPFLFLRVEPGANWLRVRLLIVLTSYMWSFELVTRVWQNFKIDYNKLNIRTTGNRRVFKFASNLLLAVLLIAEVLHFQWTDPRQPVALYFLLILSFLLKFGLRPVLKGIAQQLGLYPTDFGIRWKTDQMCSLTAALRDFSLCVCLFSRDEVDQCLKTGSLQRMLCLYSTGALPLVLRLYQCIRLAYSNSDWNQLFNFFKYLVAFLTLTLNYFYFGPSKYSYLLSLANSFLASFWDFKKDWGLLSKPNLLREKIIFPAPFYYFAMAVNLMVRCSWMLSAFYSEYVAQQKLPLLLALGEILRRSVWNVIRLEKEEATGARERVWHQLIQPEAVNKKNQ